MARQRYDGRTNQFPLQLGTGGKTPMVWLEAGLLLVLAGLNNRHSTHNTGFD
jgi:hypothetical protein